MPQLENTSKGVTLSGTAAAVGTIAPINAATLVFLVSGLSTETIGVTISPDGVNFNASAIKPLDLSTGIAAAAATLGNGIYQLDTRALAGVKFTKSNTAETVTISTSLGY